MDNDSNGGSGGCCYLRAVLFATGSAIDSNRFQPNRDESQWWNRHDALVRCTASFLFSSNIDHAQSSPRELVLLFDDDYSRIHMQLNLRQNGIMIPTEQSIISLWKKASLRPNQVIESKGLSCQLIIYRPNNAAKIDNGTTSDNIIEKNMTKRDVLNLLQQSCSIDFLREQKLNSTTDVILRKANKESLVRIWKLWREKIQNDTKPNLNHIDNINDPLESILVILLKSPYPNSSDIQQETNVIAATLHESSENELQFGQMPLETTIPSNTAVTNNVNSTMIVLFLGAVRDMTPRENLCLDRLCSGATPTTVGVDYDKNTDQIKIPLVQVRVGPVAEFTSKILSVIAFHHSFHQLLPAIQKLVTQSTSRIQQSSDTNLNRKSMKRKREEIDSRQIHRCTPQLHFVCFVEISSNEISTNLVDRNYMLWCIVRIVVTSLWRSKLAGGNSSKNTASASIHKTGHSMRDNLTLNPLTNLLTLIFNDGVLLTLHQDELVNFMAEQHQAAPTEYQILKTIKEKLLKTRNELNDTAPSSSSKGLLRKLLSMRDNINPISCVWNMCDLYQKAEGNNFVKFGNYFYNRAMKMVDDTIISDSAIAAQPNGDIKNALIVLSIPREQSPWVSNTKMEKKVEKFIIALVNHQSRVNGENKPYVIRASLDNHFGVDTPAIVVTMLQHCCYQNPNFIFPNSYKALMKESST
jgi:hypothetical protein